LKYLIFYISCLSTFLSFCQNTLEVKAVFDLETNSIHINQFIEYFNNSNKSLDTIYLNDWSNSYSTKSTPLAQRIADEFNTDFHFAKSADRGFTTLTKIENHNQIGLNYERLINHPDVIQIALNESIEPNDSYKIHLQYIVKLPSDKFTRYGITSEHDLNLKYWYITPALFDGSWHFFSNKNLDDLLVPESNVNLQLEFPLNYVAISELDLVDIAQNDSTQTAIYTGKNRVDTRLSLHKFQTFETVQTDDFAVISNLTAKDLEPADKAIITDNITRFITTNLGEYPHKKLLITDIDVAKDPVYGLNQLPNFITPFPKNFQFELTLLKSTLSIYLNNTLLINPRTDQWLKDGIHIYYMMKYMEEFYPDMKLFGSLANVWGLRSFHGADLYFNDQYALTYLHMARTNRDQPLGMAKDSLLKFNANIANKYKAGVGFKYLDDFINSNVLENSIKEFFEHNRQKKTSPSKFETFLKSRTNKNIDWFFKDYVESNSRMDFGIKKLKEESDSLNFKLYNKYDNNMPVSLFKFSNDSLISKEWLQNVQGEKIYSIPKDSVTKLVLNYDDIIPEYNQRNNWQSLKGWFGNGKPLQFRLFKDFEDPHYNQVFFMPVIEYRNIYDGLVLGVKMYNKTLLRKNFDYKISPQYGTNSKSITGGVGFSYTHNIQNSNLAGIAYGIGGSYRSYAEDLFVRKISPSIIFVFRDKDDFRSNKNHMLNFRYLDINRDEDINNISEVDEPDYNIINARYDFTNDNLIITERWFADFQVAENFGKLAFNYQYRKLLESNRQISVRLFAGTFIYNNNPEDFNYFSFALDRPTDYLFDYSYLGRSESTGIFSQQLIIAEGGFKSQLEPAFANQWIATTNVSTSIWRHFQVYGDIGFVKNKGQNAKFVYDSGFRLNLVQDYFEIYFPVYSNLGWEISQESYAQKIRFIFTVDPKSLLGIFRRKWY